MPTSRPIKIYAGRFCESELEYILGVVFTDFLGLAHTLEYIDSDQIVIEHEDKTITMPNEFLRNLALEEEYLSRSLLPNLPLAYLDLSDLNDLEDIVGHASCPVIFGTPSISLTERSVELGVDIFGSCFFLLSLYDEVTLISRDHLGRVPYSKTFICQSGLINRPIVNEYTELLWYLCKTLWPTLERKRRSYQPIITQDIDRAFYFPAPNFKALLKACVGDVLKRRSLSLCARRLFAGVLPSRYRDRFDPSNTFLFFCEVLRRFDLKAIFFVIPGFTELAKKNHQDIHTSRITALLEKLCHLGHEVGLHPYYGTYQDISALSADYDYLVKLGENAAISHPRKSRQHGLQWDPMNTLYLLDQLGIDLDSSVGFAETPGFRAGVCQSYPVYDLKRRVRLKITEQPLIAMDTTFVTYLRSSSEEYRASVVSLAKTCKRFNGEFVVLWHNCKLATTRAKKDFCFLVEQISNEPS